MIGAGNCEPWIYLDRKASNGGTKEVCQTHFLKFRVESPNSEDLAGNRAKTELQEEESLNLENLARNRAKLSSKKNLQISGMWRETEPNPSSTWQLKEVKRLTSLRGQTKVDGNHLCIWRLKTKGTVIARMICSPKHKLHHLICTLTRPPRIWFTNLSKSIGPYLMIKASLS